MHRHVATDFDRYYGTGNSASVAAGRIAYMLDLRGPAISLNTACSSSLVAVHLACRAMPAGECSMAIATGVNLILSPELSLTFSAARMLASDGHCKTFDAGADGYVRSEGCGAVLLKPLARAIEDGDTVLAVVAGSAVNQDGRSNGITAPSVQAQEAVIRAALAAAEREPDDVAYVEVHGTGTPLGDTVEMRAIETVFAGRSPRRPLLFGSCKANIGHTEAAAGMAGMIKVVQSLRKRSLPGQLHLHEVNPAINLDAIPGDIPVTTTAWPSWDRIGVAGVARGARPVVRWDDLSRGILASVGARGERPVVLCTTDLEEPAAGARVRG